MDDPYIILELRVAIHNKLIPQLRIPNTFNNCKHDVQRR